MQDGIKQNAKLYIPVYDMESKESKIWTRGRTFFNKLSSLCSRYNPLVATPFEIERVGKKGDQNTTYETYPMQSDNSKIEDFPEVVAEGSAFYSKTYDELETYLKIGTFEANPPKRTQVDEFGRRSTSNTSHRQATREVPVRRRPTNYNEEDNF